MEIFMYIVFGIIGELVGQLLILGGAALAIYLDNVWMKLLSLLLAVFGWALAVFAPIYCLLKIIFIIIGMFS